MVCVLMMVALAVVLAFTGCASPRQHFYAGQGFDTATTYYALEIDGGFEEGNPMADDMQGVLLMKLVGIGIFEGLAYLFPEQADKIYTIGAISGYGAGAWNTYQVVK